ncbi:MAG: hypothetical protein Q9211_004290, partial [Gyalolechia sp. 1 TL-2023]
MSSAKPKVLLLGKIEQYVFLSFTTPPPPHSLPARSEPPTITSLTGSSDKARAEYDALSSLADLVAPKSSNRTEFLEECRAGAFQGTKAVFNTLGGVSITGGIEGEIVEALAEAGVRFIAHNGAGYD